MEYAGVKCAHCSHKFLEKKSGHGTDVITALNMQGSGSKSLREKSGFSMDIGRAWNKIHVFNIRSAGQNFCKIDPATAPEGVRMKEYRHQCIRAEQ